MPRNTPRHHEKQGNLFEWKPYQSTVLVNQKKGAIVEVLEDLCPHCKRPGYNRHCILCGYFPEGDENFGINIPGKYTSITHISPKKKEFNPEKEVSKSNPFIQEYGDGFICTGYQARKDSNNQNYSIKFHVTLDDKKGKEKKFYFQGIVRENHSIVGIQKNSERIVSSPQYFYFLVGRTNAGYMEKFLKSVPLKPLNKSA